MIKEDSVKKYYVLIAVILFFVLSGFYLVLDLFFFNFRFNISDIFPTYSVPEELPIIKTVRLEQAIFARPGFQELESSEGYKFNVNDLVVGKTKLFETISDPNLNK